MRKLSMIIAATCAMATIPALAEMRDSPMSQQDEGGKFEGHANRGSFGEGGGRHHRWMGMEEGCKYITVRQRRGDEVITRHFRRCGEHIGEHGGEHGGDRD